MHSPQDSMIQGHQSVNIEENHSQSEFLLDQNEQELVGTRNNNNDQQLSQSFRQYKEDIEEFEQKESTPENKDQSSIIDNGDIFKAVTPSIPQQNHT